MKLLFIGKDFKNLLNPSIKTDIKIRNNQVKISGNLTKDLFENFIYLSKDMLKELPKGYSVYWKGSFIYLLYVEKNVALNYMWCNIDDVDPKIGNIKFYGGCFTDSPKEKQACELFKYMINDLIGLITQYYKDQKINQ